MCSLILLTTSSLTSGPTNSRAVAPLTPTINPYVMQQKPIPPHFFGVVGKNAEECIPISCPSLPAPSRLWIPWRTWSKQPRLVGKGLPAQRPTTTKQRQKVTADTISPNRYFWRDLILHTGHPGEEGCKTEHCMQVKKNQNKIEKIIYFP